MGNIKMRKSNFPFLQKRNFRFDLVIKFSLLDLDNVQANNLN